MVPVVVVLLLLVAAYVVARPAFSARPDAAPGMVAVARDVPDLDAHVVLDLLRSNGLDAELAVSRARPSLVPTMNKPRHYDVYVAPPHTSLARRLLDQRG